MTQASETATQAASATPAAGGPSATELEALADELDAIYADVPATCCANSGECCALTEAEMDEGWATMFPLYRAEYARIVDHVQQTFPVERQQQLLAITQERPQRCPFLGDNDHCTIYAARPLICRTYAVMNPETIAAAAEQHRGEMSDEQIRSFVLRESGMVCPRVTVTEPDKLVRHAQNLIAGAYERAIVRLSNRLELVDAERKKLIRTFIRRRSWPVRWTWGGYNALSRTPIDWVETKLKKYWRTAQMNDLD